MLRQDLAFSISIPLPLSDTSILIKAPSFLIIIEIVGKTLEWHPDLELELLADSAIDIICTAQHSDGYLNTYYTINSLDKRFTNLKDDHELYCLGHMIEATVAYYQITGKRKLLDAAIDFVSCVDKTFGTEADKLKGYPGHEIIEMALMRMYQITKDEKHLKLAKYFVDERGKSPLYLEQETEKNKNAFYWKDSYFKYQYYQAGKEVREQDKAEGHAVRAVYLYSGMVDVARETGDEQLFQACQRLWDNITQKQMYITGGIGASHYGEAFTYDYDLPNDTIYAETCASIGLVFFAKRMFDTTRDGKYTEVIERAFYNGVISGMALDGTKFFYVNPLEVVPEASEKDQLRRHVEVERQKWFTCAYCPPNLARLIASIGDYAYDTDQETFFMNMYMGGETQIKMKNKQVTFKVATEYPWDGKVDIWVNMDGPLDFACSLRIPEWCKSYSLTVNGEEIDYTLEKGYAYIMRTWKSSDQICLNMAMPVRLMGAHPKVRADIGKVAVMRGPLVYCLEEADNGKELHKIYLKASSEFREEYEPGLLNGVVVLESDGWAVSEKQWDEDVLYQGYETLELETKKLKWIPYYSWTNRTPGEMVVWVKHR